MADWVRGGADDVERKIGISLSVDRYSPYLCFGSFTTTSVNTVVWCRIDGQSALVADYNTTSTSSRYCAGDGRGLALTNGFGSVWPYC